MAAITCQAWASAQLGRHQNVCTLARRRPPRSWPASHAAARRSASVPAPRRAKRLSCVAVSGACTGADDRKDTPARGADLVQPIQMSVSEDQLLAVAHEAAGGDRPGVALARARARARAVSGHSRWA